MVFTIECKEERFYVEGLRKTRTLIKKYIDKELLQVTAHYHVKNKNNVSYQRGYWKLWHTNFKYSFRVLKNWDELIQSPEPRE